MSDASSLRAGDQSLLAIGTLILQKWRLVVLMTLGGAVLAFASVISKPALYKATASFSPESSDGGRSGLSSLAGQFGVSLPPGGQSLSLDYYAKLLTSRTLLRRLADDTLLVEEAGGKRIAFQDLLKIQGSSLPAREDIAIAKLTKIVQVSVGKTTGIVDVSVQTEWRSVSLALVTALVNGVNDFNAQSRQTQAGTERRFVESRLAVADSDLRNAEERLGQFVRNNRMYVGSPDLSLEHDRLLRQVGQKQQLYTSLLQSFEQARIREVRDTPVITIVESPGVPTQPEPRGRKRTAFFGLLGGGFLAVILVVMGDTFARRREQGDAELGGFIETWHSVTGPAVVSLQRQRVRWESKLRGARTPPDGGTGT